MSARKRKSVRKENREKTERIFTTHFHLHKLVRIFSFILQFSIPMLTCPCFNYNCIITLNFSFCLYYLMFVHYTSIIFEAMWLCLWLLNLMPQSYVTSLSISLSRILTNRLRATSKSVNLFFLGFILLLSLLLFFCCFDVKEEARKGHKRQQMPPLLCCQFYLYLHVLMCAAYAVSLLCWLIGLWGFQESTWWRI